LMRPAGVAVHLHKGTVNLRVAATAPSVLP
jgi:hypothetical protein